MRNPLPLEGITVVAVEQAVAAPFATRQLADLGARVIKIERPGGGDFARTYDTTVRGASSHFVWLNRSKESLALDLKHPIAHEVLKRLLERADVFIQNLTPGAADRLGLGTRYLRHTYPRLLVCALSGYGSSGPYRYKKAYDLLIQSETGFLSITGTRRTPSKAGIAIADIAGGMYAFSGILSGLLLREKTGYGCALDISLFDSLGEWMGYAAYYTDYSGSSPKRTGSDHATIAPYGYFTSRDGDGVYLSVQNEREWERFCQTVLNKPDIACDPRFKNNSKRVKNRPALHKTIKSVFHKLTLADIIARLDKAQIANAKMNTIQEFLKHPQIVERDRRHQVLSSVGALWALLPPVSIEGSVPVMNAIPDVGEHTKPILGELGFDCETIRQWKELGVVSTAVGNDVTAISETISTD